MEEVAKDSNGRDALAIAILKPSGVTAQWVNPWGAEPPVAKLQSLVQAMAEGSYPRGFFHKLQDRYGFLHKPVDEPDGIDLKRLLVAEFLQTREKEISREDAEQHVDRLLAACQAYVRDELGKAKTEAGLRLGGGFIARFLTQEEDA